MRLLQETLISRKNEPTGGDAAAIEALREAFNRQKKAFLAHPCPTRDERRAHLEALAGMMMSNRDRIRQAISADFAVHPVLFTDLVEVLGIAGRAAYALTQLDDWMRDEERAADPALFGTGKAFIRHQPKGVVGNIVPWNFPFDVGVGPLVEMLAAGNRIIIKPSDYTPACAELLQEMIRSTFDPDHVTVAVGGIELARTFPTLPWNHLLYTGSPPVGREVMKAAAQNLVPVTLELGGKCPAVFMDDAIDKTAVANVLGTKMIKNGQMCISVDYCLVPRTRMPEFVALAKRHMQENTPAYSRSADCTGIISERHLNRLVAMLAQAREAGYEVVDLEEGGVLDRDTRRMPLVLVLNPGDELDLMKEEIFGPILPIKAYDTLDEAIAFVNAGERPLGLYVFGHDEGQTGRVVAETNSGGACVNACAMQGALPSLAFGGSGMSGMGRHHGIEGFREFSNPRGVFIRGQNDLIDAFFPPYGDTLGAITSAAFG
ncbi:aldehyde dehydrogenase family protein [Rhodoferax sp. UBA5149]|uniref:aldehyde dehydrogenase family protein n=1 Tax=Rhodoferax sp. UBA5149 TaxID=1947379 RepID=UPI0025FF7525|nr:aldehyde dehydrogenase family protein [Rhodoferax sp. UBA5149]